VKSNGDVVLKKGTTIHWRRAQCEEKRRVKDQGFPVQAQSMMEVEWLVQQCRAGRPSIVDCLQSVMQVNPIYAHATGTVFRGWFWPCRRPRGKLCA